MRALLTILLLLLLKLNQTQAQSKDSSHFDTIKKHSPLRATIYSAIVPGLGQIYNKKYWKLPIVYGGMGTFIYFAQINRKDYLWLKEGYVNRVLEKPEDPILAQYSTQGIQSAMETARQNMEWSYIGAFAVYVLNIIDASVDAHLYTFDVSDDLTLRIEPRIVSYPTTSNVQLKLTLGF